MYLENIKSGDLEMRRKTLPKKQPIERRRTKFPTDNGGLGKEIGNSEKKKTIDLNTLPESADKKKDFDPLKELVKCCIDPSIEIKEPPTVLDINGVTTLTAGNISTVIGKAKSRKTFLMVGMISAISKGSWEPMNGHITDKTVLWFDTEQSLYHASKMVKRIYDLGAGEIKAYSTRAYTPAQRIELIETAIYTTPNLGFVVIDGVRDLLSKGINDEEEATSITSLFLKWTVENHQSPDHSRPP